MFRLRRVTLTCMQLTDADLGEFLKIWNDEFHETVTDEDARLAASMLLDLYLLLIAPALEELSDVSH